MDTIHPIAQCFLPEELRLFKIPVKNALCHAYMSYPVAFWKTHECVIVQSDKFLTIWNDTPYLDDPPFKTTIPYAHCSEFWYLDRKLNTGRTESHFAKGISNPVPAAVIHTICSDKLYLLDGTTRILWLLLHKAKAFPILCPREHAGQLALLAGLVHESS